MGFTHGCYRLTFLLQYFVKNLFNFLIINKITLKIFV